MKIFFIFLCLLVSGGVVSATTQTSANQDKPPRVYIQSSIEKIASSTVRSDDISNPEVSDYTWARENYTYNTTCSYSDDLNGTYSHTTHDNAYDSTGFNLIIDWNINNNWPPELEQRTI